jgi:hypothetical protein
MTAGAGVVLLFATASRVPRSPAEIALERTVLLARDFIPSHIDDAAIVAALRRPTVAIVADDVNAATQVGQTIIVTLAQIATASGAQVRLAFSEVRLAGPQPPIIGSTLRAGLLSLLRDAIPGARLRSGPPRSDDLVFVIGDTLSPPIDGPAWRVWARPWAGGIAPLCTDVPRCLGSWTTGAALAAPIAGAEVFKHVLRRLVPRATPVVAEQLAPAVDASVVLSKDDDVPAALDLGATDWISGGAITGSAVHSLLRHDHVSTRARVIEPDLLALNNANRYLLMRLSQIPMLKIEGLARWQTPTVQISGVPLHVNNGTVARVRPLAPRVLVGVDDIPSRWVIQREWPEWLAVGGTVHFTAVVSDHRAEPGCAGCLHPRDDGVVADIPTVAFVSYLAGAVLTGRLLLDALGRRSTPSIRALELSALRLDRPDATWTHPVLPVANCPVSCAA